MVAVHLWHHRKKPAEPSTEAVQAHTAAGRIKVRANRIYAEREVLLAENHFAARIRSIYEGN